MVFKNFPSILNNKYLDFCIMVSILKEPEVQSYMFMSW